MNWFFSSLPTSDWSQDRCQSPGFQEADTVYLFPKAAIINYDKLEQRKFSLSQF